MKKKIIFSALGGLLLGGFLGARFATFLLDREMYILRCMERGGAEAACVQQWSNRDQFPQ